MITKKKKKSELFMRKGSRVEMNIIWIKAVLPTPPPKKRVWGHKENGETKVMEMKSNGGKLVKNLTLGWENKDLKT